MSEGTAVRARRDSVHGHDDGFTLIELLVVVIIIGILAAIAIPVYAGVQNSAKDGRTVSDLANVKTSLNAYISGTNSWSPLSGTASVNAASAPSGGRGGYGNYGWASTTAVDDSSPAGGTASSWCVSQTSDSGTPYWVTQAVNPTKVKPSNCL